LKSLRRLILALDDMLQATVVICAHNPRPQYLERALGALRNQGLPKTEWELLLIDNASKTELALEWDIGWHPNARHIRENELGLSNARRRAIAEASADLLVFVDDDNVLADDYLSEALRIKRQWPTLGTWGSGTICPEFELQPASHLKPYLSRLALRDNKEAYWSNVLSCADATPSGAGMCVRASVANEYGRLQSTETIRLTGRVGTALVGHEDYEVSYVGCSLGFGMGVFPELRITHLIPKERVSDEYFLRHAEANAYSELLLNYKWLGIPPRSQLSPVAILSLVKNVVLTGGFHRRHHLARVRGRITGRRVLSKHRP
jgi:glycosyltransferase involved in cell wall biosynthesis